MRDLRTSCGQKRWSIHGTANQRIQSTHQLHTKIRYVYAHMGAPIPSNRTPFPVEQLTLWVICFGHTLISLVLGKSNAGAAPRAHENKNKPKKIHSRKNSKKGHTGRLKQKGSTKRILQENKNQELANKQAKRGTANVQRTTSCQNRIMAKGSMLPFP